MTDSIDSEIEKYNAELDARFEAAVSRLAKKPFVQTIECDMGECNAEGRVLNQTCRVILGGLFESDGNGGISADDKEKIRNWLTCELPEFGVKAYGGNEFEDWGDGYCTYMSLEPLQP